MGVEPCGPVGLGRVGGQAEPHGQWGLRTGWNRCARIHSAMLRIEHRDGLWAQHTPGRPGSSPDEFGPCRGYRCSRSTSAALAARRVVSTPSQHARRWPAAPSRPRGPGAFVSGRAGLGTTSLDVPARERRVRGPFPFPLETVSAFVAAVVAGERPLLGRCGPGQFLRPRPTAASRAARSFRPWAARGLARAVETGASSTRPRTPRRWSCR